MASVDIHENGTCDLKGGSSVIWQVFQTKTQVFQSATCQIFCIQRCQATYMKLSEIFRWAIKLEIRYFRAKLQVKVV